MTFDTNMDRKSKRGGGIGKLHSGVRKGEEQGYIQEPISPLRDQVQHRTTWGIWPNINTAAKESIEREKKKNDPQVEGVGKQRDRYGTWGRNSDAKNP